MVLDSGGRPATEHVVLLNGRPPGIRPSGVSATVAEVSGDGRFTFPLVVPGDYHLDVRGRAGFEAIARSGGGGIDQVRLAGAFPSRVVHVVSGDDIDLTLRTRPGFELSAASPWKGDRYKRTAARASRRCP